jgi:hypothetical protein
MGDQRGNESDMSGNSSSDQPRVEVELFDSKFTSFMKRLVAVPSSEIKAKIDAEKGKKRLSKHPASPVPVVPSKAR